MEIPLTQGKVAIIDDIDSHLNNYKWSFCSGYPLRSTYVGKKRYSVWLHHAILGRSINGMVTDHINGNPLDNRRCNLRFITHRENLLNTKHHRNGRLFGVTKHVVQRGKLKYIYWRAHIWIKGKNLFLGSFKTEIEAHSIYLKSLEEINEKHSFKNS